MEVFNPNPVIFAPEKVTSRRSKANKPESFWDDEEVDAEVDENTVEPIDQDEIFGDYPFHVAALRC